MNLLFMKVKEYREETGNAAGGFLVRDTPQGEKYYSPYGCPVGQRIMDSNSVSAAVTSDLKITSKFLLLILLNGHGPRKLQAN